MNPIFEAALRLQVLCDEHGWASCFIGGLAVQRWGEPRLTRDVDLTLLTGFGKEEGFVDTLLEEYKARMENARGFALENRVLLLRDQAGIPLDIALGALPFEERTIRRSSRWLIESDVALRMCSAEDLIVHKAFAAREQDWMDVSGIVERQGAESLEWDQIMGELQALVPLKNDPKILERLAAIRSST